MTTVVTITNWYTKESRPYIPDKSKRSKNVSLDNPEDLFNPDTNFVKVTLKGTLAKYVKSLDSEKFSINGTVVDGVAISYDDCTYILIKLGNNTYDSFRPFPNPEGITVDVDLSKYEDLVDIDNIPEVISMEKEKVLNDRIYYLEERLEAIEEKLASLAM
jgi:hypothetical protein